MLNDSPKRTMKEAGYKHLASLGNKLHLLEEVSTGQQEVWRCVKNHASYGIIYKNTHLEFCRGVDN